MRVLFIKKFYKNSLKGKFCQISSDGGVLKRYRLDKITASFPDQNGNVYFNEKRCPFGVKHNIAVYLKN